MNVDKLKEWRLKYAGMAMQSLLSNVDMLHLAIKAGKEMNMPPKTVIARNALSYADELIKELAGDNIELSPVRTEDCDLLDRHLKDFSLTVRTLNVLGMNGINTVRDLVRLHRTDFIALRMMGKKTTNEVEEFLMDHNLRFGMEV